MLSEPDLTLMLVPEAHAPRVARQAVAQVDSPSPDLRDAISLLVLSLVTRASRIDEPDPAERIALRAWMPRSLVRVEVGASRDLPALHRGAANAPDYDIELLDGLADRWGVEHPGGRTLIWFEIDRLAATGRDAAAGPNAAAGQKTAAGQTAAAGRNGGAGFRARLSRSFRRR